MGDYEADAQRASGSEQPVRGPDIERLLAPEQRASMFIDWCALSGFGTQGWPPGAYEQLVGHMRGIEADALRRAISGCDDRVKWFAGILDSRADDEYIQGRLAEAITIKNAMRALAPPDARASGASAQESEIRCAPKGNFGLPKEE